MMGLPVRRVKRLISRMEFLQWIAYFTVKDEAADTKSWSPDKSDWIAAMIVYHLRLAFLGDKAAGKVDNYLMEFKTIDRADEPPKLKTPKQVGAAILAWALMRPGTRDLREKPNADRNPSDKAGS